MKNYQIGDIVRHPHPTIEGSFRVWRVTGIYLGGTGEETLLELDPLDCRPNDNGPVKVPVDLINNGVVQTTAK